MGGGTSYTMKNKDTTTEYQKVFRERTKNEKESKSFLFVCLTFVFTIFYTGCFQVLPGKKPSPKVSIPTQNPSLT